MALACMIRFAQPSRQYGVLQPGNAVPLPSIQACMSYFALLRHNFFRRVRKASWLGNFALSHDDQLSCMLDTCAVHLYPVMAISPQTKRPSPLKPKGQLNGFNSRDGVLCWLDIRLKRDCPRL